MRRNQTPLLPYLSIAICALLLSAALVASFFTAAADRRTYEEMRTQIGFLTGSYASSQQLVYGTIQSVDPEARSFTISSLSWYNADREIRTLKVIVPATVLIVRQSLAKSSPTADAYDQLSPAQAANFDALQVGEHVALLVRAGQGNITTYLIFVGDPL